MGKLFFAMITAFVAAVVYAINKKNLPLEKLTIRITILMLVLIGMIMFSFFYNQNKTINYGFELDNEYKYIIYRESLTRKGDGYYYEVDFEEEIITFKNGSRYLGTVSNDGIVEIKWVIENTISDKENLKEISESEWNSLLKSEAYDKYKIRTYDGKEYYVKDAKKVRILTSMLENYKNKSSMFD